MLWRKVMKGLSAGRVQSVATRLVVERERERIEFRAAEYWDIVATFDARRVRRAARRGRRHARSRRAATSPATATLTDRRRGAARRGGGAWPRRRRSTGVAFAVRSVERKPYTRRPAAPFMTSTLQQEASRKLRFSAQHTMRVAQRLYENGYITYMRTDSTSLAESGGRGGARPGARALRRRRRSRRAAPVQPEGQERAGGARGDPPGRRPLPHARRGARRGRARRGRALRPGLEAHGRLADGRRARRDRLRARRRHGGRRPRRRVRHRRHGDHLPRLHARLRGGPRRGGRRSDEEERRLPPLAEGDELDGDARSSRSPLDDARRARYTEATLVRALEERGIGRPSTYASILGTILDRGYVRKAGPGARADVPRLRGHEPARAALRAARRLRVHRADGGRPRPDRRPATRSGARGCGASTSATATPATIGAEGARLATSATSTRARSTRSRSATGSSCASAATGRTSSATSSA